MISISKAFIKPFTLNLVLQKQAIFCTSHRRIGRCDARRVDFPKAAFRIIYNSLGCLIRLLICCLGFLGLHFVPLSHFRKPNYYFFFFLNQSFASFILVILKATDQEICSVSARHLLFLCNLSYVWWLRDVCFRKTEDF